MKVKVVMKMNMMKMAVLMEEILMKLVNYVLKKFNVKRKRFVKK
jgi:hypothetical protein